MKSKIPRHIFWILYILESIVLLIGIKSGVVSYGGQFSDSFMSASILLSALTLSALYFATLLKKTKFQMTINWLSIAAMVFLSFYFPLEDGFCLV